MVFPVGRVAAGCLHGMNRKTDGVGNRRCGGRYREDGAIPEVQNWGPSRKGVGLWSDWGSFQRFPESAVAFLDSESLVDSADPRW